MTKQRRNISVLREWAEQYLFSSSRSTSYNLQHRQHFSHFFCLLWIQVTVSFSSYLWDLGSLYWYWKYWGKHCERFQYFPPAHNTAHCTALVSNTGNWLWVLLFGVYTRQENKMLPKDNVSKYYFDVMSCDRYLLYFNLYFTAPQVDFLDLLKALKIS